MIYKNLCHKRYLIVYIDKIRYKNNYGIQQEYDNDEVVEFDDKSSCDNYIKQIQECNLKYIVIDRERKKVIENTFNNDKCNSIVYFNYQLLERYIGDNKHLEDFIDKKKKDVYELASNNNMYAKDYIFDAQNKYRKYLYETWGKKVNKKLPKLQIYDDPHMPMEEVTTLKKEEKDKIKLITEKTGW